MRPTDMFDGVRALIREELATNPGLIPGPLDPYLVKLFDQAEFVLSLDRCKCRGFVAYYCNDDVSKTAYVTLLIVSSEYRGLGIGRRLVDSVLQQARQQGYARCRLEVQKANTSAVAFYRCLGFTPVEDRDSRTLLEVTLQ